MSGEVRFVRIRGRIVPIRSKQGGISNDRKVKATARKLGIPESSARKQVEDGYDPARAAHKKSRAKGAAFSGSLGAAAGYVGAQAALWKDNRKFGKFAARQATKASIASGGNFTKFMKDYTQRLGRAKKISRGITKLTLGATLAGAAVGATWGAIQGRR